MEIIIGTRYKQEWIVTEEMLAKNVKSGDVSVFATPMMIALIESTASACLQQFLEPGIISVGSAVSVSHTAATPLGMKVYAEAEIIAVEGRRIDFRVSAFDEKEKIGEGTHSRVYLNKDKFEQKAQSKLPERA
ncbi:thioesterase family protein [Acetanaerobacterium elongatum]|uniref:Predicted thioesterase n=1 Tax=Acetanaerobacterium elongatum TaxID=258515 RepID=A0A1G9WV11_9FIRM|nr:thioesterase family protein [Acetanaerobacterium elongatum]SDM88308.1 Predicted thioesterase [Acetanaerobacterium elongatum]